jgi:hypothetical protein
MWKNAYRTSQSIYSSITWRMGFACWITKTIGAHVICNTYCVSTAKMVTQKRLNVHCLTYITLMVTQHTLHHENTQRFTEK